MNERTRRQPASTPDPETRKRNAFRRLGTDTPVCLHCGRDDWRLLELHHIAGRGCDKMTAILCRNCHAIQTDGQGDHPRIGVDPPTTLESIGRYLVGIADFFLGLATKLKEFGCYLIEFAKSLPAAERMQNE